MIKLEEEEGNTASSSQTETGRAVDIPREIMFLSNHDRKERSRTLTERYGHIQRAAHTIERDEAFLHMQMDGQAVNQGKCYYNPEHDTYYARPKKPGVGKKAKHDRIFFEVERHDENMEHESITFYVTGKLQRKIESTK